MSPNTPGKRPPPFWQLGFRPFFLGGSIHGAAALLCWLFYLRGIHDLPAYFDPITWHAHEMLFGFTGAIIAGFVLTASQNWTGIRGVNGRPLQLLVGVWALARVLALVPGAGAGAGAWRGPGIRRRGYCLLADLYLAHDPLFPFAQAEE